MLFRSWIEVELDALRVAGLERPARLRQGRQGRQVTLDGRTLLNFGSNDYLGYAGDVRLTKATSKGSCAEGFGAGDYASITPPPDRFQTEPCSHSGRLAQQATLFWNKDEVVECFIVQTRP